MLRRLRPLACLLFAINLAARAPAAAPADAPLVMAFFSPGGEIDHYLFAEQAIRALGAKASAAGYRFVATSDWARLLDPELRGVRLVVFLNGQPETAAERDAFRRYMDGGGGWLGFHISGFTRSDWPWLGDELLHARFGASNWPALPSRVTLDAPDHPVMRGVPPSFMAPITEWYSWTPNPRADRDVRVLMTLDPANYPLGVKNTLNPQDIPVVWTNRRYRMVYMNFGHGDRTFTSAPLSTMVDNAVTWLIGAAKADTP